MLQTGIRKLYNLFGKDIPIGRNTLFDIVKANHLLIKLQKTSKIEEKVIDKKPP